MQQQKPSHPLAIFCVAALSDTPFLTQWEIHLRPLQQAGQITIWTEQHITAGIPRTRQIHEHLDQSHAILFLLSPDFFASDECMALTERALASQARVIPLLLRPVDWQASTFVNLAYLPSNKQFVTNWPNQDDAFHTCTQDLRRLLGLPALPAQTYQQSRALASQNQNRVRMLRRLRRAYSDLMSQSLQGTAWLELGLTNKPDAVQNTANILLRVSHRAEQPLAPGTSITQVYDEVEHELLILGEPGAGKSTLLLELAQQLVERAEQDETHPLPIILPLSSWAVKRPPLQDWLAEQLAQIYDIPRKLSVQWVQEDSILPLLDGLDEMEEAARPACITAINAYHRDRLHPLIVSSRTAEYEAATERHHLALQGAVIVQPLTHEHVDAYLVQAGKPLSALRSALKKNSALHDLATTPLMLNILTLTYQGTSMRDLSNRAPLLLQQMWDDYIQRMVERKGDNKRYPLAQTRSQLGWLAQQMREHNQTVFYLEHLQPDWLLTRQQQRTYTRLAIRLPAIVIGLLMSILIHLFLSGDPNVASLLQYGTLGGLLGELWYESTSDRSQDQGEQHHGWGKRLLKRLTLSACIGLIFGLSFGFNVDPYYPLSQWQTDGPFYGLVIGLGSFLLQYLITKPFYPAPSVENDDPRLWKHAVHFFQAVQGPRALLVAVVTGVSFILNNELSYGLSSQSSYGLSYGLNFGLNYALISLILGTPMGDIHLTERIRWTWRNLRIGLCNSRHLRMTVLLICISIIFAGLNNGLSVGLNIKQGNALKEGLIGWFSAGLSAGLSMGLNYWLLFGLFQGLIQERIEDQDRRVANQGIHRSLRNSMTIGIIAGGMISCIGLVSIGLHYGLDEWLSAGLHYGLIAVLNYEQSFGLRIGLLIGISSALLICILTGGLAVWRHYIIRLQLWRTHIFPWQAPQFLDDATARFLLQHVGGGYSFSHRLLLDHFADMETEASSSP